MAERDFSGRYPEAQPSKDASIETLRGLAILLVVAFHAHEPPPEFVDGPGLAPLYERLMSGLDLLRMPLFTVISGYVYALRPVRLGFVPAFVAGKLRRIGVPFLSGVTLTLALSALVGGDQHLSLQQTWRAYVFPFMHFWYPQALLEIFLVVVLLERSGALATLRGWGASLALAGFVFVTAPRPSLLGLGGLIFLLPFFVWGVGLHRFHETLAAPIARTVGFTFAVMALALQQAAEHEIISVRIDKASPVALVAGLALTYALFQVRRPLRCLVPLGALAYSIFLFHQIGISVGKRVALHASVRSNDMYFALKVVGGLAVPILIDRCARRVTVLRRTLLGLN